MRNANATPTGREMLWTTREGEEIAIKDMGDRHLVRAMLMAERVAEARHTVDFFSAYGGEGPSGDMASYHFDLEMDMALGEGPEYPPIYWAMRTECHQRNIRDLDPAQINHLPTTPSPAIHLD